MVFGEKIGKIPSWILGKKLLTKKKGTFRNLVGAVFCNVPKNAILEKNGHFFAH